MKKMVIYLAILFFMVGNVWAADEFSFRGTTWGMSKAEVKKIEKGELIDEYQKQLIFSVGKILGMDTTCAYYFDSNSELGMVSYTFESIAIAPFQNIENYNKVKNSVITKYGVPSNDSVIWVEKSAKEYMQDDLGSSLMLGYVKLETVWTEHENAMMEIETLNDDFIVYIFLSYLDRKRSADILQLMGNAKQATIDELF